jgi:hypothetical protein
LLPQAAALQGGDHCVGVLTSVAENERLTIAVADIEGIFIATGRTRADITISGSAQPQGSRKSFTTQ